jgi:hypothetical protein
MDRDWKLLRTIMRYIRKKSEILILLVLYIGVLIAITMAQQK